MNDKDVVELILTMMKGLGVTDPTAQIEELKKIIKSNEFQIRGMSEELKSELKVAKMNDVADFRGNITELTFDELAGKAGCKGLLLPHPAIREEEEEILEAPGIPPEIIGGTKVPPQEIHSMQEDAEMYSHILPYALPGMFYCNEKGLIDYPPTRNMNTQSVHNGNVLIKMGTALIIQRGLRPGPFAKESQDLLRVIKVKETTGYKFYKVTLAKQNPDENTGLMPFILSPLKRSDIERGGQINVYAVEYTEDAHSADRKLCPKELILISTTRYNLLSDYDASIHHHDIHVLFRGTADVSGAVRDISESHAGKETLIAAFPYIKQCLSKEVQAIEDKSGINLTISGHSLGGADAQNFATAILMDITSRQKLLRSLEAKKIGEQSLTRKAALDTNIKELLETSLDKIRNVTINHNSSAPVTEEVALSCYSAANDFLSSGGELSVKIIYRVGDLVPHAGGVHILSSENHMDELRKNPKGSFSVKMAKITHPSFIVKNKFATGVNLTQRAVEAGVSAIAAGPAAALAAMAMTTVYTASQAVANGQMDAAEQSHTAKIDSVAGETMEIFDVSKVSDKQNMGKIAETLGSGVGSSFVEKARVLRNAVSSKASFKHGDIAETLELHFFDVQDDETKERMIPSLPDKIMAATSDDISRYCDSLLDYVFKDKQMEKRLIPFVNSENGLAALDKIFKESSVDLFSSKNSTLEFLAMLGNPRQFSEALDKRSLLKESSRKGMVLTFLCLRLANGYTKAGVMIESFIDDITKNSSFTGAWSDYTDTRGGPDNLTPMEYIARSGDIDLVKKLYHKIDGGFFGLRAGFVGIFNINYKNIISILDKAKDNGVGYQFVLHFLQLPDIKLILDKLLLKDEGIKALAKILATHNIEPNIIIIPRAHAINEKLNLQYQVAKNLSNGNYLANINVDQTTVEVFIETIMQATSEQLRNMSPGILTKVIDGETIVNLCMRTENGKVALHKIAQHMKDIPNNVRMRLADVEIGVGDKIEHFGYTFADSPMFMFIRHRTTDLKKEDTLYQLVSLGDCQAVKEMALNISEKNVYNIYGTETVLTLAAKQRNFEMFDTLLSLDNGCNRAIANIRTQKQGSNISAPLTCLCAHLENDDLSVREAAKRSIISFIQNITVTNRSSSGEWKEYTDVRGGLDNLTPMEYIAKSGDVSLLTELSTMESRYGLGITQTLGANTGHKFVHIFCITEEKAKEILTHVPQGEAGYRFAEEFCRIINAQLGLIGEKVIKPLTANPDNANQAPS